MKRIDENTLDEHVGKHGPDGALKDMKVADANNVEGSLNCECELGYDGDGLNCYILFPPP
jgi:hypothetical protein